MDWMAQCFESGLQKSLALSGVDMNCRRDILQPRAHFKGQAKTRRQLGDARANAVNPEQKMAAGAGGDADKACFVLERHGPAVGTEWKDRGFHLNSSSPGRFRR